METLLLMVGFIGLMYVLMVLPQKKKLDAQKTMISALQPGARVMLNTGMFGTIRATGDAQMVVELAPGVEVTMLKASVMRVVAAHEEEFEYNDDDEITSPTDDFTADELTSGADEQWQMTPSALSQPFDLMTAPNTDNPDQALADDAEELDPTGIDDTDIRPQGR